MPHHKKNKCADKCHQESSSSSSSSCSSSSSSSSCSSSSASECKGKGCCLPCCLPDTCDHYSSTEICCKFRAAVVDVVGELVLTDEAATTPITDPDTQLRTFRTFGNGVFIKKHFILTSSALVLAPPTALETNNRFPFIDPAQAAPAGLMPEQLVQMSKILVTVHNLNGRHSPSKKCADGHAITYEATVVMVDGAGGYALLCINDCSEWNRCLPKLKKCHPKLCRGESRALKCGDDAYVIGGVANNRGVGYGPSSFGISKGVVVDNKGMDWSGWFLPEMVLVDCNAYFPGQGMPIINKFGKLVGLQLASVTGRVGPIPAGAVATPGYAGNGDGGVAGVSQFFMHRALSAVFALNKCDCSCEDEKLKAHLVQVPDSSLGAFWKYSKGYAGIAYNTIDGSSFNTYLLDPVTGARNVLLDPLYNLYNGPKSKELEGVRVLTTAGGVAVTYAEVPGTAPAAPYPAAGTADSNFLASIPAEDWILKISRGISKSKGCVLGDEMYQIAPAVFTWQLKPADIVMFSVRRVAQTGGIADVDNHLNKVDCVQGALQDFPPCMDYLWGAIDKFPLLADPANAALGLPVLVNPQIPTAFFHPAF